MNFKSVYRGDDCLLVLLFEEGSALYSGGWGRDRELSSAYQMKAAAPGGLSWYFLKGKQAPGVQVKGVLGRGGQKWAG